MPARTPLTGRIDPPSEATIRRVTSRVDPLALEAVFTTWLAADNFNPDGNQRRRLSDLTRSRD